MSRKENVQVFTRFRPENKREKGEATRRCMVYPSETIVETDNPPERTLRFRFDHVFPPESQQGPVYEVIGKPLMAEIFNGFNATVFAYGQTGSGKTHTMMGVTGDADLKGIIPRLVEDLFAGIENAESHFEFTVKISYVEIYMEQINDLLDLGKRNLKLRENRKKETYIDGVTEVYVQSDMQVYEFMEEGNGNRSVACTKMNEASSRSHSVFLITLRCHNKNKGSKKNSKLVLVDLAGSEKVGKTEAAGQTLEEAKHINRSLTLLGVVISALTKGSSHIPYRDSKLTRMLSDSLGGNSRTRLIVTASPSPFNYDETVSTLRFGVRAKEIKNKARANTEMSASEYKRLYFEAKKRIKEQKMMIAKLKSDLSKKFGNEYVEPTIVRTRTPSMGMRDDKPEETHIGGETEDGGLVEVIGGAVVRAGAGVNAGEYKKLQDEYTAKRKNWDEEATKQRENLDRMIEAMQEQDAQLEEQKRQLHDRDEEGEAMKKRIRDAEKKNDEFELFKSEAQSKEKQGELREQEWELKVKMLEQETKSVYNDFNLKCQEAVEYKIEIETSRAASPAPSKKTSRLFGTKDTGVSERDVKMQAEKAALKERILFLTQIMESKNTQVKLLREAADQTLAINKKQTQKRNAEQEALQQQVVKYRNVLSTMFERVKHDPDKRTSYRRRASFSHQSYRRGGAHSSHNIVVPITGGGAKVERRNNEYGVDDCLQENDDDVFLN